MQAPKSKVISSASSVTPQGIDTWNAVASPDTAPLAPRALVHSPMLPAQKQAIAPIIAHSPESVEAPRDDDTLSNGLESVYTDILSKIDEMLLSARATDSTSLYKQSTIEIVATDYIKLLHTILTNYTSVVPPVIEEDSQSNVANNTILCRYIVPMVDRLLSCLDRSFSTPADHTDITLPIDVNLSSICLASLFTLLKHKELVTVVISHDSKQAETIYRILHCCIVKLVDERLLTANQPTITTDYYILHECNTSIIRALNLILLKLSAITMTMEVHANELLISLLKLLYNTKAAAPAHVPMHVTKPTSRYVLLVYATY